ncbi:MAG: D-2-hydroxyacid dehydrogenase [Gammaproteobacteria bacterium]|nr:D-2-hydroxyacid dehydrogenase [Gammaproteobacteria bacterium]
MNNLWKVRGCFLTMIFGFSNAAVADEALTVKRLQDELGVQIGWTTTSDLPAWTNKPTVLVNRERPYATGLGKAIPDLTVIEVSSVNEAMVHALGANVILGFCDEKLLSAAPNLSWVFVFHAGVEGCPLTESLGTGEVVVTNFQKLASPAIGEHAIAMMLALSRGLPRFKQAMPDGAWRRDLADDPPMQTVTGKTMLVAGLGGIGTQVARRAKALGMEVLATRNSSRKGPDFVDYVGFSYELPELVKRADVVVDALPLTAATSELFDAEMFAEFKDGAYFINIGHGGTVVTDALVDALVNGKLAGAGLDVTEPEPLPRNHSLWQMPNVIITPHVSAGGFDRERLRFVIEENLRRYLAGEKLINEVDPSRGY